ncbi:MAG: hypothetical protein KDE19_20620, partial [Caldilineaceae bacterium]|nr:hypothetical protein [Caldilineaceae bacterium]
ESRGDTQLCHYDNAFCPDKYAIANSHRHPATHLDTTALTDANYCDSATADGNCDVHPHPVPHCIPNTNSTTASHAAAYRDSDCSPVAKPNTFINTDGNGNTITVADDYAYAYAYAYATADLYAIGNGCCTYGDSYLDTKCHLHSDTNELGYGDGNVKRNSHASVDPYTDPYTH